MRNGIKISFALTLLLLTVRGVNGQNLVPNFSFEQKSGCPSTADQVNLSTGWSKYSNNSSTPDYYNACSSSSLLGVPQSFFFYQPDNRGCEAYMGLVSWSPSGDREHIGIQLNQPLIIGQKYYLSFYTAMAGAYTTGTYYECPSNNIGLRLSTTTYSSSNPVPIDNLSHLRSTSIIGDTTNWVRISGSIVADSAYNYLIIGNFYDNANTDTTTLNCSECVNNYSYYVVDDICVSTDSSLCNGGIELLSCNVSVKENQLKDGIIIYPNPANNYINILKENDIDDLSITIYNTIGQLLYNEKNINSNNKKIDISNYSNGLLFIKIESNNNSFTYKLLKQ